MTRKNIILTVCGILVISISIAQELYFRKIERENKKSKTTSIEENIKTIVEKDSGKISGWGLGSNVDEKNRPIDALSYQEKYSKYNADFIKNGEDNNEIYLTFDEGYENGYTDDILDILSKNKCKAVFFITKSYAVDNPELIRRIIKEGHVLGNHSANHPAKGLPTLTKEEQEQEIMELHDYIKEEYGYHMKLFRYPAGIFSEQSMEIVKNLGYKSVFWSFAYLDWDKNNPPDKEQALKKLCDKLHPGAIYLLHAVAKTNAEILDEFITYSKGKGYEFKTYE